jgi:CheY-like chemotaxis protein
MTLTPEASPAAPRALLVDTDVDSRAMYAAFLNLALIRTEETADGREALAKALTWRPDVIVSNTSLPGLSGLELCRLVRRDPITASMPFIFVTAAASTADLERAANAGADVVLAKPCLPETLLHAIRKELQRARELRATSATIHAKPPEQLSRSKTLLERSDTDRRRNLRVSFQRMETTGPPMTPPKPRCPICDRYLEYEKSYVGGVNVNNLEQWDYYVCAGCGTKLQYRHRTRKLRRVI